MTEEEIREAARKELVRRKARAELERRRGGGRGVLRRVDDAVRGVADAATFGFADEIAAKLGSLTGVGGEAGQYGQNLAQQRQRDATGGIERFVGQLAGAIAMPGAASRTVLGAAGKGALAGGLYGFGSGQGGVENRAGSAGAGALIGGAAGGLLKAGTNALGNRAAARAIPSIDDLRNTSQAGYRAAETAGVMVRPEGMRRVATETVSDLADLGYHPRLQPRIRTILKEMERLGNTNSTYKGLDQLRKIAGQVAASPDPSERMMATRIIQRLDDYMGNLQPSDVITGNAPQAASGIRQGRENWARMRRAEMVDTARVKAERRAASTGTGGNLENALRQNVRAILDNPKRSRGMTPAETAMAERIVSGTGTQDALRLAGRLSPTTGGLSAALNVGATAFNPLMAIPGSVGFVAKTAADRMTRKNVHRLSQMIRSGGKTAQELAALARGGQLNIPQIKRVEALAKLLGITVPELAAIVGETTGANARLRQAIPALNPAQ